MTVRPQLKSQTPAQLAWFWPALATLAIVVAFLLPLPQNGAIAGLPQICTFHRATGLPCPGCGLTRSVVSLAHGQWSEAVYFHPLGPLAFTIFVALAALGVLQLVAPQRARGMVAAVENNGRVVKWLSVIGGIVLIGIWIARLASWLPSPP